MQWVPVLLQVLKLYIAACQQGGVSEEPPWLRKDRRELAQLRYASYMQMTLSAAYTYWQTTKKWKIWANIRPVLLRQGEPGMPQYFVFCTEAAIAP